MTPSAPQQLLAAADKLEAENNDILRALRGDQILAERNYNVPASVMDRLENVMSNERFAIARPPQTDIEAYTIAGQEFSDQLAKLKTLVQTDLANLEKEAQSAGAPWTPGRLPEWQQQ
jgi:hypothetical protein